MPDLKVLFSELTHFETDLWNVVDARLRSVHDLPLTWFEPMQVMSKYTACRVLRHQGRVVDHRRRHEQACRSFDEPWNELSGVPAGWASAMARIVAPLMTTL